MKKSFKRISKFPQTFLGTNAMPFDIALLTDPGHTMPRMDASQLLFEEKLCVPLSSDKYQQQTFFG
jgi:hypothetical protein